MIIFKNTMINSKGGTVSSIEPGSSPLAFFAGELKRLRALAGLTQEQLAEATLISPGSVAAIETCRQIPSEDFARRADLLFGTDGLLARLQEMVDQVSARPWFRDLSKLERKATVIMTYSTYLVPGLLQTEDYARYCVRPTRPQLTTEEVERAVALRLSRQEILDREEPPRYWAVLDESVLNRRVGDAKTMTAQLEHLLEVGDRPGVVVQIIPDSEGPTTAGGRAFTILNFATERATVYLEDVGSARYVHKPEEVSRYTLTFDHLRCSALTDDKSRELIREAITRYAQ